MCSVPYHEGVKGYGSTTPTIFNLSAGPSSMSSFTQEKRTIGSHMIGSWICPRPVFDAKKINLIFPSPAGIELPQLSKVCKMGYKFPESLNNYKCNVQESEIRQSRQNIIRLII